MKAMKEDIETEMVCDGELAVSIVQTKDALEDAKEEAVDIQKVLATLEKDSATIRFLRPWDVGVSPMRKPRPSQKPTLSRLSALSLLPSRVESLESATAMKELGNLVGY